MIESIVKSIDEEIARLEQIKRMLGGSEPVAKRSVGRPRKSEAAVAPVATKPRRKLSSKARKAIADAQRRRWAAKKAASATPASAAKKTAAKG